jgi:hypothetical protein
MPTVAPGREVAGDGEPPPTERCPLSALQWTLWGEAARLRSALSLRAREGAGKRWLSQWPRGFGRFIIILNKS